MILARCIQGSQVSARQRDALETPSMLIENGPCANGVLLPSERPLVMEPLRYQGTLNRKRWTSSAVLPRAGLDNV